MMDRDDDHTCSYFCQDGAHAYLGVAPREAPAAMVFDAARCWIQFLGWPYVVDRVQPAREVEAAHVLKPDMLSVSDEFIWSVDGTTYDPAHYRPWLIVIRPQEGTP